MFGANGFNRNNDATMQGALTRSDLFEGFNNQDINSQLRGITNGVCDGFYAVNNSLKDGFYGNQSAVKDGFYATQSALAENRYAQQQCCCETNRNIDSVRSDAYKNTCEITTAIHANDWMNNPFIYLVKAKQLVRLLTQIQCKIYAIN